MNYRVGISKKDMTYFEPNIGLFGYGKYEHRATGIETPLYVRTYIISENTGNKTILCACEIGACSDLLKNKVIEKLHILNFTEFSHANICITANHTHSAPGGFFAHPLYNFPAGGVHMEVIEKYSNSIVESIIEANHNMFNADIYLHSENIPSHEKVSYNRSLKAYNRNIEVKNKIKFEHEATDREMIILSIVDNHQELKGIIHWFSVHTTSVGNNHFKICSDNKGYAASFFEKNSKYSGCVAAYIQKPCGDISPNEPEVWTKTRNNKPNDNDYVRAQKNGQIQYEYTCKILEQNKGKKLQGSIDFFYKTVDFSCIYDRISKKQLTSPGAMGVAFLRGTVDGWGTSNFLKYILSIFSIVYRGIHYISSVFSGNFKQFYEIKNLQQEKKIVLETNANKILGAKNIRLIPNFVDPILREYKKQYKSKSLENYPLIRSILPLQIFRLGDILFIQVPVELSITAGMRLKNEMFKRSKTHGISNVIITPYSNAFAGYIVTPEEYSAQCYEGGHTLFGKYSLNALIQEVIYLYESKEINVQNNYVIPNEILQKRSVH